MGTTETIGHIERELGMSETSRVTTFSGIKEDADGGEAVIGNPAATLDEALADVGVRLG